MVAGEPAEPPLTTKLLEPPEQICGGVAVTEVMVGDGFTVSVLEQVLWQPKASVMVTV